MTVQVLEGLRYKGRAYALLETPLDSCPYACVRERWKFLRWASTAERRGYSGDWEVKGGKLWLVGLGVYVCESTEHPVWHPPEKGIMWMFPGMAPPVLADWFSGELQSPRGRTTLRNLMNEERPFLRVFHVDRGTVTGTELRDNRAEIRAERAAVRAVHDRLRTQLNSS